MLLIVLQGKHANHTEHLPPEGYGEYSLSALDFLNIILPEQQGNKDNNTKLTVSVVVSEGTKDSKRKKAGTSLGLTMLVICLLNNNINVNCKPIFDSFLNHFSVIVTGDIINLLSTVFV